jgi:hypothetical protein
VLSRLALRSVLWALANWLLPLGPTSSTWLASTVKPFGGTSVLLRRPESRIGAVLYRSDVSRYRPVSGGTRGDFGWQWMEVAAPVEAKSSGQEHC